MSSEESGGQTRRKYLAGIGLASLAGCTSAADTSNTPDATDTETEEPTDTPAETETERPTTVEKASLPDSISVGDPLVVEVVARNPDGEKTRLSTGVSVIDVEASKRWARSFSVSFDEGERRAETTWEIEWGTDHETTLLVNPDESSISILGGEGYEQTDELTRVEVTA